MNSENLQTNKLLTCTLSAVASVSIIADTGIVAFDVGAVSIRVTLIDASAFVDVFTDGAVSTVPVEASTAETSVVVEAGRIGMTVVQVDGTALVDISAGNAIATVACITGAHKVAIVIGTGGIGMAVVQSRRAAFIDI